MRLSISYLLAISACLGAISCVTKVSEPPSVDHQRGQIAARESIQRGELLFLDPVGIIRADDKEYRAFLRNRFEIGYRLDRRVGNDFASAFNTTMDAEARSRFGERYAATFVEERNPELGPVRLPPNTEHAGRGDGDNPPN